MNTKTQTELTGKGECQLLPLVFTETNVRAVETVHDLPIAKFYRVVTMASACRTLTLRTAYSFNVSCGAYDATVFRAYIHDPYGNHSALPRLVFNTVANDAGGTDVLWVYDVRAHVLWSETDYLTHETAFTDACVTFAAWVVAVEAKESERRAAHDHWATYPSPDVAWECGARADGFHKHVASTPCLVGLREIEEALIEALTSFSPQLLRYIQLRVLRFASCVFVGGSNFFKCPILLKNALIRTELEDADEASRNLIAYTRMDVVTGVSEVTYPTSNAAWRRSAATWSLVLLSAFKYFRGSTLHLPDRVLQTKCVMRQLDDAYGILKLVYHDDVVLLDAVQYDSPVIIQMHLDAGADATTCIDVRSGSSARTIRGLTLVCKTRKAWFSSLRCAWVTACVASAQ
jgi:hypothetical protein